MVSMILYKSVCVSFTQSPAVLHIFAIPFFISFAFANLRQGREKEFCKLYQEKMWGKNCLNFTFDLLPFTYFFLNASKRIRRWPVDARLWADFFINFSSLCCFRTSSWVNSIRVCFICCWFGNWCCCCGCCCHSWCEFLRFIFHQFSTTFVAVKSKFFTWY